MGNQEKNDYQKNCLILKTMKMGTLDGTKQVKEKSKYSPSLDGDQKKRSATFFCRKPQTYTKKICSGLIFPRNVDYLT